VSNVPRTREKEKVERLKRRDEKRRSRKIGRAGVGIGLEAMRASIVLPERRRVFVWTIESWRTVPMPCPFWKGSGRTKEWGRYNVNEHSAICLLGLNGVNR